MEKKSKPVVVKLPSKLSLSGEREHVIPSEDELYNNREFIQARIRNLEEQLSEIEISFSLAVDRYDYFVKVKTDDSDDAKATSNLMEYMDKEYELAKKELSELRKHLDTLR